MAVLDSGSGMGIVNQHVQETTPLRGPINNDVVKAKKENHHEIHHHRLPNQAPHDKSEALNILIPKILKKIKAKLRPEKDQSKSGIIEVI